MYNIHDIPYTYTRKMVRKRRLRGARSRHVKAIPLCSLMRLFIIMQLAPRLSIGLNATQFRGRVTLSKRTVQSVHRQTYPWGQRARCRTTACSRYTYTRITRIDFPKDERLGVRLPIMRTQWNQSLQEENISLEKKESLCTFWKIQKKQHYIQLTYLL